jgi:bla regulator protein blaR1
MPETALTILIILGKALLHSLWQAGVLWLVLTTYAQINKNISAERLTSLSFIALLLSAAAFVFTFLHFYTGANMLPSLIAETTISPLIDRALVMVSTVYLLLLLRPLYKLVTGYNNASGMAKKGLKRVPWNLKIYTIDAAAILNIKRKVRLLISSVIHSPLTIGFLKPIILLPVAAVNNLTTQQLETIILHELAHIKRNDYLINFISQLIVTLLYFNPFVKSLAALLEIEREKSADNWVIRFEYDTSVYASALLALAKINKARLQPFALNASGQKHTLLQRIQWMAGDRKRPAVDLHRNLIAFCSIVLVFLFTFGRSTHKANTESRGTQQLAAINTRQNINNIEYDFPEITNIARLTTKGQSKKQIRKCQEKKSTTKVAQNTLVAATVTPPQFIFINNKTTEVTTLQANEEQNIQSALNASKEILAGITWKQIDNALAETMTSDQKEILRQKYVQMIDHANWQKWEDKMRLSYKKIDWEKASRKLNASVNVIKADSIYNRYNTLLQEFKSLKKQNDQQIPAELLNSRITAIEGFLKYMDSLQTRKTIDL